MQRLNVRMVASIRSTLHMRCVKIRPVPSYVTWYIAISLTFYLYTCIVSKFAQCHPMHVYRLFCDLVHSSFIDILSIHLHCVKICTVPSYVTRYITISVTDSIYTHALEKSAPYILIE